MRIFVCDYMIPDSEELESFICEADDIADAEAKAILELKQLGIPKRYLINLEEF